MWDSFGMEWASALGLYGVAVGSGIGVGVGDACGFPLGVGLGVAEIDRNTAWMVVVLVICHCPLLPTYCTPLISQWSKV